MMIYTGLGQATTPSQTQIASMIIAAANQYGVPPALALGIASHESGFNPNAVNVNTNGTSDYGVMQLNDTTVQTLGISNPMDPQQNIDAGVSLLGKYLQQYNGNTTDALWAYASGSGAVSDSNTPNTTAANFISYVQGYDPTTILSSLGGNTTGSSTDSSTQLLDSAGQPAQIDTTGMVDPTTVLILVLAAVVAVSVAG